MAALEDQMQSMLPSADDDIRPEDYTQYKPDDFTGRSFAADSFQETKDRFMDAGKIDVDPDDPAIFTAYKRAVDYLKDTGLAGLGLADTAFKYAVGSVAQVMPTEQLEKRMARDLYSMPEAFGGAVGAKSLTQLDDAADAFLAGSKQVAQKLKTEYDPTMVRSFVGATPPTYQKRETPLFSLSTSPDEVLDIYNLKSLMFREPIAEFAKTVNIPKKGLLGSEFLSQIKKNPSIPETSIQDEIIDPSKRYTRDELLNVVEGRGISQSFANIAENKVTQFEQYQRQRRDAGFVGGTEINYFDIPVVSNVGFPGKKFKAHSQHYEDGTLVHVRGSIIDGSVPFSEFNTGPSGEIVIDSTEKFIGFDTIIDDDNFLLVEEIQSDLLTKGYAKPKSPFEDAGSEGTLSVGLPPIRKNKQAVDEALKVLIAKAAQQGVDKIVIPPASRIALARGRELKKDKGDRFYRTYVTDLNKSLKELEDNYPVIVHRDVELPYLSKADVDDGDPFGMMNEPDFMDMEDALQAAIDAQDPDAVIEASAKIFDAGNKGTVLDISELIDKYKIEQPRQFAEGGVAMNKQMEMAFMQQGGLKDDGMRQDPVSGNQVPSGSMASEVRDDIPAQLSEGEYVVPADVVRFFGVKFFEDLRSEAKMGLQSMEANGRIGGEPVPMETGELSDEEFARLLQQELGGTLTTQNAEPIKAAGGTYVPGQMSSFNPDNYGLGFSLTPGYTPPAAVGTEPVVETEASCAAKGMVLGPDGVCIVAPQAKNDNDNDGPIVPAPAAGEGQGLGGAWYEGDEDQLLDDPEAYITDQLGRGEMLDSGLATAATMLLPGGIVLAAGNKFADTEGIARARAALMIAKARGTLNAEKIKSLEDAISKDAQGNFIVDKDGKGLGIGTGINYANSFAKSLGFKNLEDAFSKDIVRFGIPDSAKYRDSEVRGKSNFELAERKLEQRKRLKNIAGLEEAKKIKASQSDDGPSSAEIAAARIRGDKKDKKQREKIISSGNTYSSDPKTAIEQMKNKKTFKRGGRAEGGLMLKKKRNKK